MPEEIKDIISKIISCDIEHPMLLGTLISDVVFKKQEAAIVMDDDRHCFLVHSSRCKFDNLYQVFTKLLSVLSYLETNALIYRQCDDAMDELTVFYDGCNDLKQLADGYTYSLGNGYKLQKEDEIFQITSSDNKQVLSECHNISALYNELCYYLKSFVYPAAGLSDYVAHDYLSENDYHSKNSLRVSRCSVWVAVCIACLSPIVSLLLGNQWGVTEIKESQYNQFIQRTATTDTVILEKHDTIVEYVHDTFYTKRL